jgi:hypothetical protein
VAGALALAAARLTASPEPPAEPAPAPTPSPEPPAGLRLDVEKHVKEQAEAARTAGLPRFSERVDVHGTTPQAMLERHLEGQRLDCGPTGAGSGAPTELEMRDARPIPSPYADFLPLVNLLRKAIDKRKAPRYFVYRATRGEEVTYALREGPMPASMLYAVPGTRFELVEGFVRLGDARRALRRLERGFGRAVPRSDASPPAPWMTAQPCPAR